MHVIKRNTLIYNEILFVVLSFIFIHIVYSLDIDGTAFDVNHLLTLIKLNPLITVVSLISIITIFTVKKISLYILPLLSLLIFYKTFSVFLLNYDKLHLLLNVCYVIFSYNMILLLNEELSRAMYNPMYSKYSLDVEGHKRIKIKLKKGDRSYNGVLTNYDQDSFVVKVEQTKKKLTGLLNYELKYDGIVFEGEAKVCLLYDGGLGLRIHRGKKDQSNKNWYVIYDILSRRGIC